MPVIVAIKSINFKGVLIMETRQLQNLYQINGLTNYQLRDVDDLLRTHGVDYRQTYGFEELSVENRESYKVFLVGYYNGWGLDARLTLIPKSIFYVPEISSSHPYGYLRFNYTMYNGERTDWLHIVEGGREWY